MEYYRHTSYKCKNGQVALVVLPLQLHGKHPSHMPNFNSYNDIGMDFYCFFICHLVYSPLFKTVHAMKKILLLLVGMVWLTVLDASKVLAQDAYCNVYKPAQSNVSYAGTSLVGDALIIGGTRDENYRLRAFLLSVAAKDGSHYWTIQAPDTLESSITGVATLPDSTILVAGLWRSIPTQVGGPFVARIRRDGTPVWSKIYTWKYYPYVDPAAPTGIAVSGTNHAWISAFKVFFRIRTSDGQIEEVYGLDTGKVADIRYDSIRDELILAGVYDVDPLYYDVFVAFVHGDSVVRAWKYGGSYSESLRYTTPFPSLTAQKGFFVRIWHEPGSEDFFFTTSTGSFFDLYNDIVSYPRLSTLLFKGSIHDGRPQYAKMLGKIQHVPVDLHLFGDEMHLLCDAARNAAFQSEAQWIRLNYASGDIINISRVGFAQQAQALYEGLEGVGDQQRLFLFKSTDFDAPGIGITSVVDGASCVNCTAAPQAPVEVINVIDSLQPTAFNLSLTRIDHLMDIDEANLPLLRTPTTFELVHTCIINSATHQEASTPSWSVRIPEGHPILQRQGDLPRGTPVHIAVYSINGQRLYDHTYTDLSEDKTLVLPINLRQGVYFIKIEEGRTRRFVLRAVKW